MQYPDELRLFNPPTDHKESIEDKHPDTENDEASEIPTLKACVEN